MTHLSLVFSEKKKEMARDISADWKKHHTCVNNEIIEVDLITVGQVFVISIDISKKFS